MGSGREREIWVDNVKVVACILVALGHFYQSMVKTGLTDNSVFYQWFDRTIYYFRVPLFFICSGFLFQKYSHVTNFKAWGNNTLKKFVSLGVPYFVFSTITWILKTVFSSEVNSHYNGLVDTLFSHPASPYWYLYILFFLFLISINTKRFNQQIIMFLISFVLKMVRCYDISSGVYFIDKTMDNWIWFVLGMVLAYDLIKLCNALIGIIIFIIFLCGSTMVQLGILYGRWVGFILAVLACYSIISIVHSFFKDGVQNKYWQFCAKYTMPVFLMHTIFAAPLRSIMLKIGIDNLFIHVVLGVAITFVGPVIAMMILEKMKPLDFIVYPTRYIKIGKRR